MSYVSSLERLALNSAVVRRTDTTQNVGSCCRLRATSQTFAQFELIWQKTSKDPIARSHVEMSPTRTAGHGEVDILVDTDRREMS